jgi:PPOX class probable F420-dependent enzyme
MTIKLTADQEKLLHDKNFAHVATLNPDGSPQVTPVWVEYDGTNVIINSEQKRKKVKNMERDPRVSLSIADAANPYKYIEIRGKVVAMTTEGANDVIDQLAKKYMNADKYPYHRPGDVRVTIKIAPELVKGMG